MCREQRRAKGASAANSEQDKDQCELAKITQRRKLD
jgi:hypothetical protein